MSLRWRIAVALAALAAAATVTASVTSYLQTRGRLYHEIDNSLAQTTSAALARGSDFGPRGGDSRGLESVLQAFEVYSLQVLSPTGTVMAKTADQPLPVSADEIAVASRQADSFRRDVRTGDRQYRVLTTSVTNTRLVGGGEVGAIQVGRDLNETSRVLESLRFRYLLLSMSVSVVAAAIGWFLAGGASRSLVKLTQAVEDVAQTGQLKSASVGVEGSDEAGRLAAAFNNMLEALRKSREQQQQLVQDAGHELRTPITSVRTNVAILRQRDRLTPDAYNQTLDDLDSELGELTGLVNEIVELATDARDEEPIEEISLQRLALRAAQRVQRRSGHPIVTSMDDSLVNGRPAAIERAITNLLDNATKFDTGSAPIELSVRNGVVEVHDHGPGFAPGDEPHVFERFWRSTEARSKPGSGLGLAIVRDVAVSHGGLAYARNHPNGGAVVGVQFPLAV